MFLASLLAFFVMIIVICITHFEKPFQKDQNWLEHDTDGSQLPH